MVFSKGVYDKLKFLAQIVLPALGTLYATVSGLYAWPNTEEVVGTVIAVDAFLGVLLSVSTKFYNDSDEKYDGEFKMVDTPEGKAIGAFNLERNPEALGDQKEVLFKVTQPSETDRG
jgi:hypothetical protein